MMFRLMRDKGGLGLAAPQVGIDARMFITHWGEIFVNPVIWSGDCMIDSREGCLSLPGVIRVKRRFNKITLIDSNRVESKVYEGEQAIVIQHECDHLKGTLITD